MTLPPESTSPPSSRKGLRGALESNEPQRRSFEDYRRFIQNHYDGLPGALTRVTGLFTGHETLAGRLIRPGSFDVRGCKRILDAACGNGRYSRFLLRQADADALITSFDLSPRMLQRARNWLRSERVSHTVADLTRLPYADASFDAIVCGWALEHVPNPRSGLSELARVLQPGGKLLLLSTEDTLTGAICSRFYHCRTYNRAELRHICGECGLRWEREMWFSSMHRLLKLGGIVVELRRVDASAERPQEKRSNQ